MHVGDGKFLIAAYFDGSGLMPPGDMMCPANLISVPISSFFFEIVMFAAWHLDRAVSTLECNSASVGHIPRTSQLTLTCTRRISLLY